LPAPIIFDCLRSQLNDINDSRPKESRGPLCGPRGDKLPSIKCRMSYWISWSRRAGEVGGNLTIRQLGFGNSSPGIFTDRTSINFQLPVKARGIGWHSGGFHLPFPCLSGGSLYTVCRCARRLRAWKFGNEA